MADVQAAAGEVAPDGVGVIGTQAEYARYRGWSKPYVTKLKQQGKLPIRDDGKIDFAEADHALAALADPGRDPAPAATAADDDLDFDDDDETGLAGPGAAGEDDAGASDSPARHRRDNLTDQRARARAVREAFQAKQAQLEYEERAGLLIKRRDVEDAMVTAGRTIRSGLDAIPGMADELVAIVTGGGGPQEVRQVLRAKVRELEDRIAANLTRIGAEDDDDGEEREDD